MIPNVKEIIYTFKTTFGEPLDVRYSIESLSAIDTELPIELRYEGMIVYVKNTEELIIFKKNLSKYDSFNQFDIQHVATRSKLQTKKGSFNGQLCWVEDEQQYLVWYLASWKPFKDSRVFLAKTWGDALNVPSEQRYIGQFVFVLDEHRMYQYKQGIMDSQLVPADNTKFITRVDRLEQEYPEHARIYGDIVFVNSESRLYSIGYDKKLKAMHSEILTWSNEDDILSYTQSTNRPYMIINIKTGQPLIWANSEYIPLTSFSIPVAQNVETFLGASQSNMLYQRKVGSLYYMLDEAEFYSFYGDTSDESFRPLVKNKTISTISKLNVDIPEIYRYAGMMFYVEDEQQWYYFNSKTSWRKMGGFTSFQTKDVFGGKNNSDYVYIHNKNVNTLLLYALNSEGEKVELAFVQGLTPGHPDYNPSNVVTHQQQMRNMITVSADIQDTYTLQLLVI